MKRELQQAVIDAATELCENAASLPDGNAQIPSELSDILGDALVALSDYEEREYKEYLKPGQTGLNSAQVSLQRLMVSEPQLEVERLIDAADRLYLSVFDKVVIPGSRYLSVPESGDVRYLPMNAIEDFINA